MCQSELVEDIMFVLLNTLRQAQFDGSFQCQDWLQLSLIVFRTFQTAFIYYLSFLNYFLNKGSAPIVPTNPFKYASVLAS